MIWNREMLQSHKMYTIICILESREEKRIFKHDLSYAHMHVFIKL